MGPEKISWCPESELRDITRGGAHASVHAEPLVRLCITRETEADVGVGRGPGDRPTSGKKILEISMVLTISRSGVVWFAVRILPVGGKSHDFDGSRSGKSLKIEDLNMEIHLHPLWRANLQYFHLHCCLAHRSDQQSRRSRNATFLGAYA